MSDQQALRAAILDAPQDDAPRLIYADWLDEHNHSELATFIRAQVYQPKDVCGWYGPEGARACLTSRVNDLNRIGVVGCWEVTDNVNKEWFREHAAQVIGTHQTMNEWTWLWRRGFVDEMRIPADDAFHNLKVLLETWPIRKVTVVGELSGEVRRWLSGRCKWWPAPDLADMYHLEYRGTDESNWMIAPRDRDQRWQCEMRAMFGVKVQLEFAEGDLGGYARPFLRSAMGQVAEEFGRRVAEEIERLVIGGPRG